MSVYNTMQRADDFSYWHRLRPMARIVPAFYMALELQHDIAQMYLQGDG